MTLEELYQAACSEPSDINEHLPTLRKYAEQSTSILELGTRYGTSTTALLAGQPRLLWSVDINDCRRQDLIDARGNTLLRFVKTDSLAWNSMDSRWDFESKTWQPTPHQYDLLFIDTEHTFSQVTAELGRFSPLVTNWIILHDTVSFPPVLDAVREFLSQSPQWSVIEDHKHNNGLIVLERRDDERLD